MTEPLAAPADSLCLDFANTRYWRGTDAPTEELPTPAALLGWCGQAGRAVPSLAARLAARWADSPAEAAAGQDTAMALREALYRIFAAHAAGQGPAAADIGAFNAALEAAPARRRLVCDDAGAWAWAVPDGPAEIPALLAPVLWSAADLLAGPRQARVRACSNPACGWLFLDDSKGANRRWCSMASCGNRAKAHRHYARQKARQRGEAAGG